MKLLLILFLPLSIFAQGVGINIPAPTARIHITSGTTTFPPVKINSGSLTTIPQIGAIETDGTHIYWTDNTTARLQLDNQSTANYSVYTAIVTQAGTATPNAIILSNTLGGSVTISRIAVGAYRFTTSGLFTTNKTWVTTQMGMRSTPTCFIFTDHLTTNIIQVNCTLNNLLDGDLNATMYLEIRVYP